MNIAKSTMLIILLLIVFYFLYQNGYMVMKNTRATKFIGRERGRKASFTSCSGTMKWVLPVKEARIYEFSWYLELEKGDVEIVLTDRSGTELLKLNSSNTREAIMLDCTKYKLEVRFKSATGYYELEWE